MNNTEISVWIEQLSQLLLAQNHRGLVILKGDISWGNAFSNAIIEQCLQAKVATQIDHKHAHSLRVLSWGSEFTTFREKEHPNLIHVHDVKNYRHHLGRESNLVFFADDDFHPDAFTALSGTILAGGLFIWLCSNELSEDKNNLFVQRILAKAADDPHAMVVCENGKLPDLPTKKTCITNFFSAIELDNGTVEFCKTLDQKKAVLAIDKVITGHRNRPLLLTADRGRGKSSALAIAVGKRLLSARNSNVLKQSIIVTAPHIGALSVFFQQLKLICPEGTLRHNIFTYQQHQVQFIAIDVILKTKPEAHLLLVDEAAGIPVYILSQLVNLYSRVVFSSTQHGYEGAGRGFFDQI